MLWWAWLAACSLHRIRGAMQSHTVEAPPSHAAHSKPSAAPGLATPPEVPPSRPGQRGSHVTAPVDEASVMSALATASCSVHVCPNASPRRWLQAEWRNLGDTDAPEVDPLLQKASQALRARPALFHHCAHEVASARHSALFQRCAPGSSDASPDPWAAGLEKCGGWSPASRPVRRACSRPHERAWLSWSPHL